MMNPLETTRVDRFIERWFPRWGAQRMAARIAVWKDRRDIELSYRGGVSSRLDRSVPASTGMTGFNHPLRGTTLTNMRDKARNLDRNNTLASSSLDRMCENVVGSGPKLQCRTTSQAFNAAAEAAWKEWEDACDIRDLAAFPELCRLLVRTEAREGDVGVVLVDRGGMPVIQPVEGDMLEAAPGNSDAVDGIEWTNVGRAQRYWVKTINPTGLRTSYTSITADNFIYLLRLNRFSQVRGEPIFAQTFWLFDHLDGWIEAEVTAARAGACQALLITKPHASSTFSNIAATTNDADGTARKKFAIEPLSVHYLSEGEDVKAFQPQFPSQNIDTTLAAFARLLGLNMGLALEQVMLDFSRVTYLSSRAMRGQVDAVADVMRDRFERKFLRRVYRWWVSKMVKGGKLTGAPEDFWAHEWIWDSRPWVDPDKDLRGALMELDAGLTTLEILAKERGREFAELAQKRSEEIKLMREIGVPPVMSTGTRNMDDAAKEEPEPEPGDDPQPGDDTDDTDEGNEDDRDTE